ncbi:MAG: DUF2027 domain-containing protein [Tenuifilaceae bacterium]|jgi:hypothetical protein|nr:DUF2027 domain-containing protein [Tenuifilaceae bacterium]
MKCKVGDKVRFLNDIGGGKVTRIVKNTVYVLGDDGFEIPVLQSDIVVINQAAESKYAINIEDSETQSAFNKNIKEKTNPDIDEAPKGFVDFAEIDFLADEVKDELGDNLSIHLAFVPTNQSNMIESAQKLFLINDSSFRLFYTISKWDGKMINLVRAGFLYPDSKEIIKEFARESINEDLTLNVQCIFFKNRGFTPQQPEYYDIKINPTKFFRVGSFISNDFFEEKAIIYSIADTQKEEMIKTLTNKDINKIIEQKDSIIKPPQKSKVNEVEEVDLHIEELIENPAEFTPGQIIEMQLARFKLTLEGGLKSQVRKMVFIHGVGNGKLKHELRKELEKNYPKLRYQDASFKEYGYGATMVFLRSIK